jgi:hypothetical protein
MQTCRTTDCPLTLSRRSFLASVGAAIAATEMGLFDFASSAFGGDAPPPGKPAVNAVFIRPVQAPDVDWPGSSSANWRQSRQVGSTDCAVADAIAA